MIMNLLEIGCMTLEKKEITQGKNRKVQNPSESPRQELSR